MSHHQVIQGGWIDWAKKDLSECLDLEELEKLFHAEDDKKAGGKKIVLCVGCSLVPRLLHRKTGTGRFHHVPRDAVRGFDNRIIAHAV